MPQQSYSLKITSRNQKTVTTYSIHPCWAIKAKSRSAKAQQNIPGDETIRIRIITSFGAWLGHVMVQCLAREIRDGTKEAYKVKCACFEANGPDQIQALLQTSFSKAAGPLMDTYEQIVSHFQTEGWKEIYIRDWHPLTLARELYDTVIHPLPDISTAPVQDAWI